jgi:hypothetical protein
MLVVAWKAQKIAAFRARIPANPYAVVPGSKFKFDSDGQYALEIVFAEIK